MPVKGQIPIDILTCMNLEEQKARLATLLIWTLGLAWQGCSVMQEAEQKVLAGNGCKAAIVLPLPVPNHITMHTFTRRVTGSSKANKGMMLQISRYFHKIEVHRLKPRRHRFPSLRLVITRKTWRKFPGLEEPFFFVCLFTG